MHKGFLRIGIFIILLVTTFFFMDNSWASVKQKRQVNNHKKSIKNISFHIVKKGETLYRIAKSNGMSVNELMELNGLRSNKIKIGQRLVLGKKNEIAETHQLPPLSEESKNSGIELEDMGTVSTVLSNARDYLGVPYRLGGTTTMAFDCSGFVQKVYKSVGIDLPRTAREQYKVGREVERDEISHGDLVFFKAYSSYPSHVGIYIGDNYFIHASTKNRKVRIDSLDETYYRKRFIGAKRLIEAETPEVPSG